MIRGAGGFSIAPNLRVESVWGWNTERSDEIDKIIQASDQNSLLIPTLMRAFSEQRLSPYDTFYYYAIDGISSLMDVCLQTPLTQNMALTEDR